MSSNIRVLSYVPKCVPPSSAQIERLWRFVSDSKRLLVLTGAGISTESGMPDYRSAEVGLYSRGGYKPMMIQEFLSSDSARRRYWARSFMSWDRMANLKPNISHKTLVNWGDRVSSVITQNVDGLHQAAGSKSVIELHGSIRQVKCTACSWTGERTDFQNRLSEANRELLADPRWKSVLDSDRLDKSQRPDGDVDLTGEFVEHFRTVDCTECVHGVLMPSVVFFGDNVPKHRTQQCIDTVDNCDSLLVLGTSLQAFSSYRLVLRAHQAHTPILVVNIGPTRAEKLNIEHVEARLSDILQQIDL